MSLSKGLAPNKFMAGKVLMAGRSSATTVAELEGSAKQMAWNNTVEEEYLERVRAKAAVRAKEILELAQAEARHIKQQAQEEGYAQGWKKAADEVEQVKTDLSGALGHIMTAIQASGRLIWANNRESLVALVHAATEKMTGLVLAQDAQAMMENILERAVETIGTQRNLMISVHPEMESLLRDELSRAQARYPHLKDWRVRPDPSLEPGGLIVECDEGMVDNSMEGRRARVAEILDMLTLPDDTMESLDPDDPQFAPYIPAQAESAPPAVEPQAPPARRDTLRESWEQAAAELASEAPRPQVPVAVEPEDLFGGVDPFEAAMAAAEHKAAQPVPQQVMDPSLHLEAPYQPGSPEAALAASWAGAAQEMDLMDAAPTAPVSGQDATDDLFAQAQAAMETPAAAPAKAKPAAPAPVSGQDATDDLFAQTQAAMETPAAAQAKAKPAAPAPVSGQDATDDLFAQAQAAMEAPAQADAPAEAGVDEAAAAWAKAAEEFDLDDAVEPAAPVQGQDGADDLFAQAQAAMASDNATHNADPAPESDTMLASATEAAAALASASEEEPPDADIDPFETMQQDIDAKDLADLDPFEAAQAALKDTGK